MFKKLGICLLVASLFCCQLFVFGGFEASSEVIEWIKGQQGELTQSAQDELEAKVKGQLAYAKSVAMKDDEAKAHIKELNEMMSEAVGRLDATRAVNLMDTYSETILLYMKSGVLSGKDVQWAAGQAVDLMGSKVAKIEDVNKDQTASMLVDIVACNTIVQGLNPVKNNQKLTSADLKNKFLAVEKAHRVLSSQLIEYGYNGLGRSLSKQIVFVALDGNFSLEAGVVKELVANNIEVIVQEMGIRYVVPVDFLKKHVGDFQVQITNLSKEAVSDYDHTVTGGLIEPLVIKDVKIGYETNKTPIRIYMSEEVVLGDQYTVNPYALVKANGDKWKQIVVTEDLNGLVGRMMGTEKIALGKFTASYTDLNGHWASTKIGKFLGHGIVDGVEGQMFDPNGVMTRGDFVKTLINVVGTEGKSKNSFVDVPASSPYADIIESAIYYGFTIGVEGDKFGPETPLSREELVALVAEMYEVKYGYRLSGGFMTFKDMNEIAPYAKDAVAAMKDSGYISGYDDNTFKPKNTVNRAEAISVLYEVLK